MIYKLEAHELSTACCDIQAVSLNIRADTELFEHFSDYMSRYHEHTSTLAYIRAVTSNIRAVAWSQVVEDWKTYCLPSGKVLQLHSCKK
ncbi:hypothetical protein [Sporosarcina cyprini]|uniref:hypothetical protein n=1 Tax=Sporosarcina cyprini TaxID=2910523 RepID=UPI001EE006E9|nr:hypothetical protein [Sporosarcina cyprini]MCG3090005.1 hypothetical protein [Sporosarcina cyprini]